MPKKRIETIVPLERPKETLGRSPAVLAKRNFGKPNSWCPKPDIEFDCCCDPENPRIIAYNDIYKAAAAIRQEIPVTPIEKSKRCNQFGMNVYYKFENFTKTGSFHERGALNALLNLNEDQRRCGLYTASNGNWAMALAYKARRLRIPTTIVFPEGILDDVLEKCIEFKAKVIVHGKNLAEAKRQAFVLMNKREKSSRGTYLNGYDHPHVIAGAGTIGIEILDQLPYLDAILIPVGGGGLIAGVATVLKHHKSNIKVYGLQSPKCCNFYKALENGQPYETKCDKSLADTLAVPTAGYNAFHTARSLIDKMILVGDDWIARAVKHLVEYEKIITGGASATTLGALLTMPNAVPELQGKTVVCIITGGNIDIKSTLGHVIQRAQAIEGKIIKVTVKLDPEDTRARAKVLMIIANQGAVVVNAYTEKGWIDSDYVHTIYWNLICETIDLKHARKLKNILERIYTDTITFEEEPFSPLPICICHNHWECS